MRITDNPCRNCDKRTIECRLMCLRYKVYNYAKRKEYEQRKIACQQRRDIAGYIADTIDKRERRKVKYTPPRNGGIK